ncbi:hypothetical protein B5F79_06495 [Olsenella sp. An285]|uniref:acyltransferase family protein n=1 Tax=Olsenella sp. An285 TaxID=1965621 RepID=UPI000B3949F5|nr:acyltransferase [Olsenella sp. An285]OUO46567.1 hypothetical protein B5F79_06495 [Olsenella sp. An285]
MANAPALSTRAKINHRIDYYKGLACILVVFIHARFPSPFGEAIVFVARAAVPFFFMVSGFFAYKVDEDLMLQGIPRKAKHIACIAFWSCLYNFACELLVAVVSGTNLLAWLQDTSSPLDVFLWVVFNNAIPGMHLWFLFALLYCYGALYLLAKMRGVKIAYLVIPALFACCWVQQSFQLVTLGLPEKLVPVLSRNWLFEGMPFFLMGHYLASKKDTLTSRLSRVGSSCILPVVCVGSVLGSILEGCVLGNQSELLLFTPSLTASCFIAALIKPETSGLFEITAEKIGRRYSLLIYVIHWSIFKAVDLLIQLRGLQSNVAIRWIEPIGVVCISLLVAVVFTKVQTLIKPRGAEA